MRPDGPPDEIQSDDGHGLTLEGIHVAAFRLASETIGIMQGSPSMRVSSSIAAVVEETGRLLRADGYTVAVYWDAGANSYQCDVSK